MTVIICSSPAVRIEKHRHRCSTCETRRTFIVTHFEWYEPHRVCLHCGDRWNGDERQERPFKPGWRRLSVEKAKRDWKEHSGE
ncbi:MAG: hypothetical protein ACYTAO_19210 [Planctomycetota bacterium]|jgi:hypothetical protein